ncbi:GAF domain-containing sensor histidine kinase [Merismopedia glauca]|uniref:histidine kinase n=1 Tax=Merismopedia glauca CCAP 1448/3 TaxID=1296344 RepID=A0A2T1BZD0_9CYAN|nr:ATP-binding protein [Merismopedia glauca]PSB01268.1 histidine kinase [Merismopedia glauca CCAP 1448/3]
MGLYQQPPPQKGSHCHVLQSVSYTLLLYDSSVIMGNISDTTRLEREITDLLVCHEQTDVLLSAIARTVGTSFAADVCWLIVGQAIVDHRQVFSWHDNSEASGLTSELSLPAAEIFSSDRLRDLRQPLVINDLATQSNQDLLSQALLADSIHSLVLAPAQLSGKIIGYLLLVKSQPNQWRTKDADKLKTILALIAIAIDKSQIYQKSLTLNHYQTILPELSRALAQNLGKEQIFQLALSSTAKSIQIDLGLVLLIKYDEAPSIRTAETQIPKATVTVAEEWLNQTNPLISAKDAQIGLSFGLNECVLLQKAYQQAPKPLIVSNDGYNLTQVRLASLYPEFSDWLIVPLIGISREPNNRGMVLGFLVFQHSQTRIWHPEELALVNWISTLTSTAIIQSQTLFQVQNLVEERTAQLQSSLEVQAMLYEKTRQQLEQVRQAKKAREEFMDSISHELRTPLTAMNLAIRMLRQPGLPDERRANYFNILEQQCNQEISLVNDLLDWGRLESKQYPVQVQSVNLRQLLDQLAQSFANAKQWTQKGLKLELEFPNSPIHLQTDQDILKRILSELLTNAGKYSLEESNIYVRVNRPNPSQQIILTVTNTGNCIPDDEITNIFEPLHRPPDTAKKAVRGTGLGLALVKSFVQHLHGAIAVSSNSLSSNLGCETCFTLTLPQTVENF